MTSPASIRTQSQAVAPSILARPKPASFNRRITLSAIAPTWRCERPDATTIASAMSDLPLRSMVTTSSALSSSNSCKMIERISALCSSGESPESAPSSASGLWPSAFRTSFNAVFPAAAAPCCEFSVFLHEQRGGCPPRVQYKLVQDTLQPGAPKLIVA